ncbi:putative unusual protein kinase regulating ubiquinone biosynthesis (AarF/ABC1/UbiB family) [Litorivivens lipolytica]|uniref:Putative unusual protein kinase regulating ubiquinone biosynthesis (AarF/ABC1/UbiB family) n=1 Tax=Litorivivens lipolytica TaxID=1524264 RepID=A0A7W4Z687_9GAMM|nr:AarF/UbiB family protein [Litorivivens lipolytica]MBB3046666.1 putative unusual protein kinase regulating ubiquinone biosynthesis (AarF/ABC1/UbiB family) [Litorivivens lipolytica]
MSADTFMAQKTPQKGRRPMQMAELGVRGSVRLLQTFSAVYPKALRWLIDWRVPAPAEMRELFESLGVTYIKFGQFIASSPSIFPKEYVDEFQKCLDQTPAIPFRKVKAIIEEDLGKPLDRVFEHISPQPLASASIAQVHAATLLSGEQVVVKVQKPGVKETLTTDLNAVYLMTRLCERIIPNLDRGSIADLVEEMYQAMLDECDFVKEADNLIHFSRFLNDSGNTSVVVPKPNLEASNERVLTMERFYGVALTDMEALKASGHDAAESLFNAMNTWFASLTQCAFFHADLHSGNLMLLNNGQVGFIDFGMVGRIKPSVWEATFKLFMAVNEQDYQTMAESMLAIGVTRSEVDVDALARDIQHLFGRLDAMEPEYLLGSGGSEPDGVTSLMSELGDIAKSYGIRFPRSFTLLLKQFLYFDRYMDLLAPGANIFGDDRVTLYQ